MGAPASSSHVRLTRWNCGLQCPSDTLLRRTHCSDTDLPGRRVNSGVAERPEEEKENDHSLLIR